MFRIVDKRELNSMVTLLEIEAPFVAKKAQAGQFIIFRVDEFSERVPLTIADYDREKGTVTIIFQKVGLSTQMLAAKEIGDTILDFVGPLGVATEYDGMKKVAVVGDGVGCAIAYPQAKALHNLGVEVDVIAGFRNKDIVILEDEFRACSSKLKLMTDDGTYGEKGLVTDGVNMVQDYTFLYTCGPEAMLKAVYAVCKTSGQFSFEERMGCGFGACMGCTCKTKYGNKRICKDGPVQEREEIVW